MDIVLIIIILVILLFFLLVKKCIINYSEYFNSEAVMNLESVFNPSKLISSDLNVDNIKINDFELNNGVISGTQLVSKNMTSENATSKEFSVGANTTIKDNDISKIGPIKISPNTNDKNILEIYTGKNNESNVSFDKSGNVSFNKKSNVANYTLDKNGNLFNNIDYGGIKNFEWQEFPGQQVSGRLLFTKDASVDACKSLCAENPFCTHAQYNIPDKKCEIKSYHTNSDHITGVKRLSDSNSFIIYPYFIPASVLVNPGIYDTGMDGIKKCQSDCSAKNSCKYYVFYKDGRCGLSDLEPNSKFNTYQKS
jgi:PAN domain.